MTTTDRDRADAATGKDKIIHYTVNAEGQETTARKLTGRQILENAGFTPAADYALTRNKGGKAIGLDDEEPIREGEAFTAKFNGPTPVS